jgi:hypothetical protein
MTFTELCAAFKTTPAERLRLWRMLTFLRLEKMLEGPPDVR